MVFKDGKAWSDKFDNLEDAEDYIDGLITTGHSGDFEVKVSKVWKCVVCNKEMTEYIEEYCCDGRYCGCGGMPINPLVCSQECWNKGI